MVLWFLMRVKIGAAQDKAVAEEAEPALPTDRRERGRGPGLWGISPALQAAARGGHTRRRKLRCDVGRGTGQREMAPEMDACMIRTGDKWLSAC